MKYIQVSDDGLVSVHEALPPSVTASLLGIVRTFWEHARFYDADGTVWRGQPTRRMPPPSLLRRLLATTVYNPRHSIAMSYEAVGTYEVSDLKAAVSKAVAEDKDILTQFMEPHEIQERLQQASGFVDIAQLLGQMLSDGEGAGQVVAS